MASEYLLAHDLGTTGDKATEAESSLTNGWKPVFQISMP